jgi:hypothetical protein
MHFVLMIIFVHLVTEAFKLLQTTQKSGHRALSQIKINLPLFAQQLSFMSWSQLAERFCFLPRQIFSALDLALFQPRLDRLFVAWDRLGTSQIRLERVSKLSPLLQNRQKRSHLQILEEARHHTCVSN